MTYALDACIGVDDVDRVTFADLFGRAFRRACAARNAFISDFHGHGGSSFLFDKISIFSVSIPQKYLHPLFTTGSARLLTSATFKS